MPEVDRRSTVLLQSCDDEYAPFLDITGPVNATYAALHGYAYRQFVGFKSSGAGANFNRYHLIGDEIERGEYEWALWLDADALVVDLNTRLEPIVERTPEKLFIACRGTLLGDWDINNGVFLIQLRHPLARSFIDHMLLAGEQLGRCAEGFHSDQRVMHDWLKSHRDTAGRIPIVQRYADDESDLFNYDGPFIKHVLREVGDRPKRLATLRSLAETALASKRTTQSNHSGSDACLGQVLNFDRTTS
jgi:hypothetical protein